MAHYIVHRVAKGIQNRHNSLIMSVWKTNFNMPAPDVANNTIWVYDYGPVTYYNEATSFDLTGFLPGWEAVIFCTIFHWVGPAVGTAYLHASWRDTDGSLMFTCMDNEPVNINLASGKETEVWVGCNQGVAGWEIDVAGNYSVRSEATGDAAVQIAQKNTTIAFSNVPSTTQLGYDKRGYMWVEGNYLCYICHEQWKHNIPGTNQGYVDIAKAGYVWIDTNDYLHWITSTGYDYKADLKIQQFISYWSGSSTTVVSGETAGYIYTDAEFGGTHIGYIGYNGYKFLTGSGHDPYQAPY